MSTLTIQRAYNELSRTGYTEAATHKGTWVAERLTRTASMEFLSRLAETSATRVMGEITEAAGLRSLASSSPDPSLFDDNDFCTELSDLRQASKWHWGYSPAFGAKELLAQISRLLRSQGLPTSGDQLLVTMGASHALSLVARMLSGSKVLLEDPRAAGLKQHLEHSGAITIPFRHDEAGLDLSQVSRLIEKHSPQAIVVSTLFQNPTGTILDPNAAFELLKLARRHGVLLVELDTYRAISFEQHVPLPLAARDLNNVIYIGSFSNSIAPGLRLGYVRASTDIRQRLRAHGEFDFVAPPVPIQIATANYLANGGLQRHLSRVLPRYKARRDALLAAISAQIPGAKATFPRGGFSTWVSLPARDYGAVWDRALHFGVAVGKGHCFSEAELAASHVSLSFSSLAPDSLRESVKQIAALIPSLELSA